MVLEMLLSIFCVDETIRDYKLDFFAILETGRSNFSVPFLHHLSGGLDFVWYCLPPQGRSGGILVGINSSSFIVKNVVQGKHCVNLTLRNKSNGFEWASIHVYGAAQDEHKHEFLAKLARICEMENLPMLVGEILIFCVDWKIRTMIISIRVGLLFSMLLSKV
jgi:hypothetical protein